jgi:hypothetical protein
MAMPTACGQTGGLNISAKVKSVTWCKPGATRLSPNTPPAGKASFSSERRLRASGLKGKWSARPFTKSGRPTARATTARPLEAVSEVIEEQGVPQNADLRSLFAKALAAAAAPPRIGAGTVRTVYERSRDVRDYVLARAGNNCEGCESSAPFARKDGSPYLEPHHIRRVSDGGPDHPAFVIALCPNCHRQVHAGADGESYNSALLNRMAQIQP